MKISELISRLVILENLYGDTEVKLLQSALINGEERRWQADISEVESDTNDEDIFITLY